MIKCPIDYFVDNLVFGRDKTCWGIFEMKGYDYDMLSDDSKKSILNRLTLFIANISTEAKFIIVPVTQDIDTNFDNLINGLQETDPLYESAVNQAISTKNYLKQTVELNGKSNDYKTFVVIKLQKEGETELATQAKEALEFIVKSIINDFNAFMNTDSKDILKSKISSYSKLSERVCYAQSKRMILFPVDTDTTQWLLRRMTYRGLPKDVKLFKKSRERAWLPYTKDVELAGRKYLRPRKRELVNLFSGTIKKDNRTLKIEHENGTSYQTFLVITNIPDDMSFPGDCEWIYLLQQYNRQAEICIHIKTVEHREAIRKIDMQRRTANSQIENIEKAHSEIPDDLWESKEEIDALENEFKYAQFPLVQTSVVICLSDNNQEALDNKASEIRNEYEDMNFIVERPLTDQFALFMQCIPSVSFTVTDFIMRLTPQALASGLIGVTHELGDFIAPYIGTTGQERKNVFLSFTRACMSNMSACATFYGNLGVGKSFNANSLLYLHVIYGAYGLVIDPKGERTHWVTDLPALNKGFITLVTLSPDPQYKGMLDPFNIFRGNVAEAAELAINLLTELFKIRPKDRQYTALLEAIEQIKTTDTPSMEKLSGILNSFPPEDDLNSEAKLLSRQIRLLKNSGMAQLIIGEGTENAISLDNRLNILQIQNLKLPSPDTKKEDYTQEETVSSVLMMVIAAFTRKFFHSRPNNFKIALFDESWMLGKTVEGEKLISYTARMSRSLYSALILNGHSVTDLPNEGVRNSITYKFCFKTSSSSEAERMLEYMNLEKTESNITLIMSLKNAQCLFQDLNGRVGVLEFDAVFEDLINVFSTTPVDISKMKDK